MRLPLDLARLVAEACPRACVCVCVCVRVCVLAFLSWLSILPHTSMCAPLKPRSIDIACLRALRLCVCVRAKAMSVSLKGTEGALREEEVCHLLIPPKRSIICSPFD